ncbi:TonB-dependent receptor domain-containing protein [uncultured Acetobacteroides sp.]|uniref:TonB-dependent receptor domain-containing protein n=1 Tax=uncultured Acetobacteroides sp. TaxID=1760811 RepID=UPI0029F51DE0|nr:TonB-dependent receptor [uncultured Acetobacteroides sp.]
MKSAVRIGFALSVALTVLAAAAFAQQHPTAGAGRGVAGAPGVGQITGTVIDKSTNQPVEYATVTIYRAKDSTMVTGGITDHQGRFSLERIAYGVYNVKVDFIGYTAFVKRGVKLSQPSLDIGSVILAPATQMLQGVTVTGHQNEVQSNLDKKVYNIDKTMYGTGGTALDIMQSLPAVQVDFDGNVSMRGAGVTILIDGRPSNLVSLDQMPAVLIERVEVISNPSAKYDPEGVSGIINIILKKDVQRGLNGIVNLTAGWNDKWMGNVSLNYRKNKVNLFTNYTLRSFHSRSYQDFWSQNTLAQSSTFQQKNTSTISNMRMQNIQLGVDYFIDKRNTISTSFTLEPRNMRSRDTTSGFFDENSLHTYDYGRHSWNTSTNKGGFEYDLSYKHELRREGAQLTAEVNVDRGNSKSEQGTIEQYEKVSAAASNLDKLPPYSYQLTNTSNDNTRSFFRTDLELPMAEKGRIEAGYQISNNQSTLNYNLSKSYSPASAAVHLPQYDNDFDYNLLVNALYFIYGRGIGKFKLQAGVRAEQTHAHGVQKTQSSSFTKNYLDLFPSAFIKYDPNDEDEYGINYSRRINRPRIGNLNPFENRTDTLNITKGNPDLNPEYVNSFELGYTKQRNKNSLSLTGFYRKTTGVVAAVRTQLSPIQSITTYVNLNSSVSYGAEASCNVNLLKWWNVNASGSYFYLKLSESGSSILNSNTRASNSWTLRATNNWYATKNLSFQLMCSYKSPVVSTGGMRGMGGGGIQGKTRTVYYFDAGARYNMLKDKISLSLRMSDIFNTNKYIQDGYGNSYTSYTKSWRQTPNIFLGFSYKINNYKLKPQKKEGNEEEEDMVNMPN